MTLLEQCQNAVKRDHGVYANHRSSLVLWVATSSLEKVLDIVNEERQESVVYVGG